MSCGVGQGISIDCAALLRVGGVDKRAYVFNVSDVVYTTDGNGYITAIDFPGYEGLYKIQSTKQSHSGGYNLVVQDPGGNKYFSHEVIIKCFPDDPTEDAVIHDLAVASLGVILETNNNQFIMYGKDNGLGMTAATQNTGQASASDISDVLTFTGDELAKPKRILLSPGYQTTLNYLETLVV